MKIKRLLFLLVFAFATGTIFGQQVELTPFVGYQFGGKMNFIQGELKVDNNINYGLNLDIPTYRGGFVELYWSHMESRANWKPYNNYITDFPETSTDVSIDYIQVGGVQQGDLGTGIVKAFGVLTIGAAYFNIKDPDISDVWRFAATLGGGIKIHPTDRIGIRLQGRLLMPMYGGGGGFYCGIGTGGSSCGVGVSSYSLLLQGDLTAGLIILIGK